MEIYALEALRVKQREIFQQISEYVRGKALDQLLLLNYPNDMFDLQIIIWNVY